LLLSQNLFSQAPDTLWTKTFGGNLTDIGNSVIQSEDGGFVIAGVTESFGAGGEDVYLIKTDPNGDTLWTKTFGGSEDDEAKSIRQTNDNGFIISGTTASFGNGQDDFLLLKTDSLGNTEWFKPYGGSAVERGKDALQTFDGGYIVVGDSNCAGFGANSWIIKTDQLGSIQWEKKLRGQCLHSYYTSSVQQLSDSGFVVCGTYVRKQFPFGYSHHYFLSKYSIEGDHLWIKSYQRYGFDDGAVVNKTNDGNLIIGGNTSEGYGPKDIWLIKVNSSGNIIWQSVIGNLQENEILTSLESTIDDGYIITFSSSLNDVQMLKTNSNGVVIWEKTVGGTLDDRAYTVQQTADNGYIVAGSTKSFSVGDYDVWLLRFDNKPPAQLTVDSPNGGEFWIIGQTYPVQWSSENIDFVKLFLTTNNGSTWELFAENVPASDSFYDFEVPIISSFQCKIKIVDESNELIFDESDSVFTIDYFVLVEDYFGDDIPTKYDLIQNFPNPFNPSTTIYYTIPQLSFVTLKVYDVLGNEVTTLINEEKPAGIYEVEFKGDGLTSGIYFYRLTAGKFTTTKKMVILK